MAFCKRANGAAFAVGEAAFNALHEAASPGVRRGVANGAESRQQEKQRRRALGQGRAPRTPVRVIKPCAIVLEEDGLRASSTVAPRQSDAARAAAEIDMHLDVSHCVRLRSCI